MSCFWDGIREAVHKKNLLGGTRFKNAKELAVYLKTHNERPNHVSVCGTKLTPQNHRECVEAVSIYNPKNVKNGYLCGTQDSFLILLCYLTKSKITQRYLHTNIVYQYKDCETPHLTFQNDKGHFWSTT